MANNKTGDDKNDIHVQKNRDPRVHESEKPQNDGDADNNRSNYFIDSDDKSNHYTDSQNDPTLEKNLSPEKEENKVEVNDDDTIDALNKSEIGIPPSPDNSPSANFQRHQNGETTSSGRSTQEIIFDREDREVSSFPKTHSTNLSKDNKPEQENAIQQNSPLERQLENEPQKQSSNSNNDNTVIEDEKNDNREDSSKPTSDKPASTPDLVPDPVQQISTPVNNAPTSKGASIAISEDVPHSFSASDFQYNDSDADVLVHITITELPTNGVLTLNGSPISEKTKIAAADISKLSFVPNENESGDDYGNFKFTLNDGKEDSAPQNFEIDVTGVADTPILIVQSSGNIPINIRISGDHYDPKNGDDVGAGSPQFQVFINGEAITVDGQKTFTVDAERGSWENFRFEVSPDTEISSVDVKFINDAWEGRGDKDGDGVAAEDRNLIVDNLNIGGEADADGGYSGGVTIEAETAYYDRPDSDGYETMPWSGTLSFDTSNVDRGAIASGPENTAISLNIQSALTDASETHIIQINDVPEGAELSAGHDNGDGTWNITPEELDGLTVTPPKDYSGSFDLSITSQSIDGSDVSINSEILSIVVSDVKTVEPNVIEGNSNNNKLSGTSENDLISGHEGNDRLSGDAGDDVLKGGSGNDRLSGGDGDDRLIAGDGNDTLSGGRGDDVLKGGAGNDRLSGDAGDDILKGGSGNDRLSGGDGDDRLIAGDGNDTLSGGRGDDVLKGGAGNDRLSGDAGDDVLKGGSGNDRLSGGDGDDRLIAGDGNDTLSGGRGDDVLKGGAGNDRLSGDAGDDVLKGGAGNDRMSGGDGDDRLIAGDGNDTLSGGRGDDLLKGGAGNDRISGGDGDDRLIAGDGNNQLYGGEGDDHLVFIANTGNNTANGGAGGPWMDTLE